MNLKMLFPSYRERFLCLLSMLSMLKEKGLLNGEEAFLNIGCGEGDYDRYILDFFSHGFGCDIDPLDIQYCQKMVRDLCIEYKVSDAQLLNYKSELFECVVCIDVVEHTESPESVVFEAWRVLKPGGFAIFSFPQNNFPFLYDPINFILSKFGTHISIGAYAYGHNKLIDNAEFEKCALNAGFKILDNKHLSKDFVGLLECYWPGLLQRLLKSNSSNNKARKKHMISIRPGADIPRFVWLTDSLIKLDKVMCQPSSKSIGRMVLLKKLI